MARSLAPPVVACVGLASVLALSSLGCVPGYSPSGIAPTVPIRRTTAMELRFVILGSFAPDLERFVDWIVVGNPSVVRRIRDAPTPATVTVQMFASGRPGQAGTCAVVMSATGADGALLVEHTFSHDCGWSSTDQPDFVTQTVMATIEQVASALHDAEPDRHAASPTEEAPELADDVPDPDGASTPRRAARRGRRPASSCSTACPRAQRDENGCCP